MSRLPVTGTISGYPSTAARVVQAPTAYTGTVRPAASPVTTGPIVRSAAPVVSTVSASPVTTVGSVAGARQARVITAGTSPAVSLASPTTYVGGTRTVVQGATATAGAAAPRIVGAAKVISAGAARPDASALQGQAYTGPIQTQSAYEAKHKDDPQLANLKELRKACGLKNVPVNDALQTFKSAAEDGKLTREKFMVAYAQLLAQKEVELPPDDVQKAVFDLFDRDDNDVVDMMELICGASLLCTGTEEDKIHAVFNVFDENGDGVISMDEMFKFLTSVFKVVLTPNVMAVMNSMGVTVESPEDLASVTALECFKTADLNHDGRLSVAEFKNWFFAPRNDPSFLFSPVRKLLQ